jgi:hypothetical protein
METVMFVANSGGAPSPGEGDRQPITADEIWDFCSRGIIAG